jgi:hypothetical protein
MAIEESEWKGKTAVYTAVITDYEHLGGHTYQDGVDYLYFTDGGSYPIESRWRVIELNDFSHLHPRRLSKFPKHVPHMFPELMEYKYVIWIDGDMQIRSQNFVGEILNYLDSGMVISPHFDNRHCAYGEASIRPLKYINEPMDPQIDYYKSRGFPTEYGLYETGVIARDMTDPQAKELGMRWYIHNMVLSYQDQVSLPFVMWEMDYTPSILPKSFRDFNWVHINAHKRED